MPRALLIAAVFAGLLPAQLPREWDPWWNKPIVNDLNLSSEQKRQIRSTVREYSPHLLEVRASIERAELELERQFNEQPVDVKKANETIEHLATARAELTRSLSQLSLKLRTVITPEQWQRIQSRRQPQ